MYSLLFATVVSFAAAMLATRVCRRMCIRFGIVDKPDRVRKLHARPVPRVGGIAVAIALFVAYSTLLFLPGRGGDLLSLQLGLALRLAPAALIVFLTGLIDDLISLSPRWKLLGQTSTAIYAWTVGLRIHALAGIPIGEIASLCLTVLWLLICCNALNLIDGLDGLAAGIGLLATLAALGAALLHGNIELVLATAPLAGALLGFLPYNLNPASIFLGDCGSLLIGFLLGCFAVMWNQKSDTLLGITAPLMALGIPIVDTGLSIARRFIRHKPIFGSDRGHIHHRLLDRGLNPRRAVLALYVCSAIGAVLSLLQVVLDLRFSGLIILVFCACVWLGIRKLRYVEFNVFGTLLAGGAFLNQVNAQVSMRSLQEALAAAKDPGSCWMVIRETCEQFGFNDVRLSLCGTEYGERMVRDGCARWTVRIPLSEDDDYIQLNHEFRSTEPEVLASLADVLRTNLEPKIAALHSTGRQVANW